MVSVSAPRDDRGLIDHQIELRRAERIPGTGAATGYPAIHGNLRCQVLPVARQPRREFHAAGDNRYMGVERRKRQLPIYLDTRLKTEPTTIDLHI